MTTVSWIAMAGSIDDPAFYPMLAGSIILTLCAAYLGRSAWSPSISPYSPMLGATLDGIALLILACTTIVLAIYVSAPIYFDHAEAIVAATTGVLLHGRPLYPDWTQGDDIYGNVYGPAAYAFNAPMLKIVPTIWSSKLTGALAGLASVPLQFWAYRRASGSAHTAWRLALIAFLLSSVEFYTFSNRPDSFCYFLTSLAVAAAVGFRPEMAAAVIGVSAGLATSLKADALLYFVPLLPLLTGKRLTNWLTVGTILGATGLVGLVLPFVATATDPQDFIRYIAMIRSGGISVDLLCRDILMLVSLLAMPAALYWLLPSSLDLKERVFGWLLAAAMAIVASIGAKPGAGMHHLYGFAPVVVLALARLLRKQSQALTGRWHPERVFVLLYFGAIATYGAGTAYLTYKLGNYTLRSYDAAERRLASLKQAEDRYAGLQMGVSDMSHYQETFQYPELVFSGSGMALNPTTWMELKLEKVSETFALRAVQGCRVPAWIVPATGVPFSLTSYYGHEPLFSNAFRAKFVANYQLVERGGDFAIWTCRDASTPS